MYFICISNHSPFARFRFHMIGIWRSQFVFFNPFYFHVFFKNRPRTICSHGCSFLNSLETIQYLIIWICITYHICQWYIIIKRCAWFENYNILRWRNYLIICFFCQIIPSPLFLSSIRSIISS